MRRPLYGIHPVSPRQHLEDYSKTRDMKEREPFRPEEHKAATCFATAIIALILYSLGVLAWQIVKAVL